MNIVIGGDLVPTEKNTELFNTGNLEELLGKELLNIWEEADMKIFNLEVPLSNTSTPLNKYGPNLIAPLTTIKGIKKLSPTLITLANNHILDQGILGLDSTISILKQNNLEYIGVGKNIASASKSYIIRRNNKKIGVYSCAEKEFSIATNKTPGANPFDPIDSIEHIADLKKNVDYLIVLYHGGKEQYRYPSPYLQKICREMANTGADLIVCQHSHCVGSKEVYNNSTIIYGQGNFIFRRKDNEFWNTGLLININFEDSISLDYIPIVSTNNGIRKADNKESKEILDGFFNRSQEITDEEFILEKYREHASMNIDNYLRTLSGLNKWIYRLDKYLFRGKIINQIFNERTLLAVQNYVECEAHRELLLEGIKLKVIKQQKK